MFDEEEKREDTVTTIGEPLGTDFAALFGPGPGIAADVNAIVNTLFGHIRTDLQAGGTGLGVYDPSPEDGIVGLKVISESDRGTAVVIEQTGYFDGWVSNGDQSSELDSSLQNGRYDQGEKVWQQGELVLVPDAVVESFQILALS